MGDPCTKKESPTRRARKRGDVTWADDGDINFEKIRGLVARPVETWSEEDLRTVMGSDAYWRFWDPDHEEVHKLVDRWYEHFHREVSAGRDTRERINPVHPIPSGRGGRVRVRAHMRVGVIPVRAHERARRKRNPSP